MAKILILAKSGFGKTTSLCGREKFSIKGLDPKETFIIQCINRNLPSKEYKLTTLDKIAEGNRIQVGDISGMDRFKTVADIITMLSISPYKNIVVDDFNFLSQDYYMANAMKGGWQVPKDIGYGMGIIFSSFQSIPESKNLICMAHYEEYKDKAGDSLSYRFKSIGNMTDAYITPEGKFDIILYGKQSYDESSKTPVKQFVTTFDGEFPAKDSLGVLDSCPTYIPNDLAIVVKMIDDYYKG